jgi:hypothetical protein
VWNTVVLLCTLYIATVYLYRLAFIDFYIGAGAQRFPSECSIASLNFDCPEVGWFLFDELVDVVFIVDLVLQFFFSFRDDQGVEVTDSRRIAKHYLGGMFFLNFLACVPYETFQAFGSEYEMNSGALRTVKICRILRVSRLIRLFKLGWLTQLVRDQTWNVRWRRLLRSRWFRILGFLICLLLTVHVLACGWYLCAAFHDDAKKTWVERRIVGVDSDETLATAHPFDQWLHSMYFILTVFTTVGFGDISALSNGEMAYVCVTMLFGVVFNGIIIGAVQAIMSEVDKTEAFVTEKMGLVEAFANHTDLDSESTIRLGNWVKRSARTWQRSAYNREDMQLLITSRGMPGALLEHLSQNLFSERLSRNRFLSVGLHFGPVPQRLPLLLAVMANRVDFLSEEVVYQMDDFPFTAFLVLGGTFAHVGEPTLSGGKDRMCTQAPREQEQNYAALSTISARTRGKLSDRKITSYRTKHMTYGPGTPAGFHRSVTEGTATLSTPDRLYPYQMFSAGSYFGEVELLASRARYATMRCESHHGTVLVLRKESFLELSAEFPKFGTAWLRESLKHERQRQQCLAKLTQGLPYRHLAARTIQTFAKQWLRRSSPRLATNSPQPAWDSAEFWGSKATLPRLLSGSPLGKRRGATEAVLRQSGPTPPRKPSAAGAPDPNPNPSPARPPSAASASASGGQATTGSLEAKMDALRQDFAMLQQALLAGGGAGIAAAGTAAIRPAAVSI